ncbi:FAD-binding protein [Candidatus Bathyarchaeota archaeon]|nr:FAD-binding protein [Candidatus Bathyarchaeota archaeon]
MSDIQETDVLVIGSGGAGLRAGIAARANGSEVTIVSKSRSGLKTASIVTNGWFRVALGGLSKEEHYKATMAGGKELNDPLLVETMVKFGPERVKELEEYGVALQIHQGMVSCGENPEARGLGFIQPLVKYAKEMGIEYVENCLITSLIKIDDSIVGAVGFTDEPKVFSAKAVVLATGGCGALYPRTDCPLTLTGDGYALAYDVGAVLRDMEFIQFVPVGLAEPGQPLFAIYGELVDEGRILNNQGEDIVEKYGITERPLTTMSRDLLSRAIMLEILEGRGVDGSLLLDATGPLKEKGLENLVNNSGQRKVLEKIEALEKPFKISPVCHFTMSGVHIDKDTVTSVKGLFAAGEVTGGVHGANRIGGNAMTDIIVFGAIAGESAADYATKTARTDLSNRVSHFTDIYKKIQKDGTYNPVIDELKNLLWQKVGVIRDGDSLQTAITEINLLRDSNIKNKSENPTTLKRILESSMALQTAELVTIGAQARRESRGTHYRRDHPEQDQDWLQPIFLQRNLEGTKSNKGHRF